MLLLACIPACQQEMSHRGAFKPLQGSDFFPDGQSARPLPAGTVHREAPAPDSPLVTGVKRSGKNVANAEETYVETFPFAMTEADLKRGQERFTIYCAVCHDPVGTGHGKIVERGYVHPPNYHTDVSRGLFRRWNKKVYLTEAPVGYFFEVISRGFGAMPDYAAQVEPRDRWRIVAYIRALQLSQRAELSKLPPDVRQQAEQAAEQKRAEGQR